MWINNERDESNVEPVKRPSFLLTFTNNQCIIYSQMQCFIKEVLCYILIWHFVIASFLK